MREYFNLAIDDICPVDGSNPRIPALKSDYDIKMNELYNDYVNDLDEKFTESAD